MDPYLEQHWRDVHTTLVVLAREALNEVLPPDLVARTEERVYIENEGSPIQQIAPDVHVIQQPTRNAGLSASSGAVAVAEPVIIELESEPVTESFIQIVDVGGGTVVTAVEFVSPSNKLPGEGREAYRKKRRAFLASDTNLVEIDLTRAGDWLELLRPYRVPQQYRTTYRAAVRRAAHPERAELYPIALQERLPAIHIPLRRRDADVTLNLQPLVDRTYQTGRYEATDYAKPLDPPLPPTDSTWVNELLNVTRPR